MDSQKIESETGSEQCTRLDDEQDSSSSDVFNEIMYHWTEGRTDSKHFLSFGVITDENDLSSINLTLFCSRNGARTDLKIHRHSMTLPVGTTYFGNQLHLYLAEAMELRDCDEMSTVSVTLR